MRINPIEYKEVPKSELYNEIEEGLSRTNFYDKYGYQILTSPHAGGDVRIKFNHVPLLFPLYSSVHDIKDKPVQSYIQQFENSVINYIGKSYNQPTIPSSLAFINETVLQDDNNVGLFKLRSKDTVVGIVSVKSLTQEERGYVYLIYPSDTFDFKSPKTAALITDTIDYYKAIQSSIISILSTNTLNPNVMFHKFYEKL